MQFCIESLSNFWGALWTGQSEKRDGLFKGVKSNDLLLSAEQTPQYTPCLGELIAFEPRHPRLVFAVIKQELSFGPWAVRRDSPDFVRCFPQDFEKVTHLSLLPSSLTRPV